MEGIDEKSRVSFVVDAVVLRQARKKIPLHGELSAFLRACLFVLAKEDFDDVESIVKMVERKKQ